MYCDTARCCAACLSAVAKVFTDIAMRHRICAGDRQTDRRTAASLKVPFHYVGGALIMYLRVETDYKSYDYQCTNRAKLTPAVNGQMQVRICNTFKHANSTLFP